jgi:peroxiredoxin
MKNSFHLHKFIVVAAALVAATTLNGCTVNTMENEDPSDYNILNIGNTLPAFSAAMNNGDVIHSDSLRGNVNVIIFFDTECYDCRAELVQIDSLYRCTQSTDSLKNIKIIAIARDEESSEINAYWQANSLTIPYSPQSGKAIYELFAKSYIPRTYICDSKGVIRYIFIEKLETKEELLKAIKSIL